MSELKKVSSNPHIRSKVTTSSIMLAVVVALLPAAGFGIYNFGLDALILIAVTVATTVITEYTYEKFMGKDITIGDYSAVVTGLLLGLNLPSTAPWWIMTNFDCDAYTGATPLAALKNGESVNVLDMVIGRTSGTIGETSMIAIVIGACFLVLLGVIDLRISGSYILSFIVFLCLFGGHGMDAAYISAHLAGGGLMLGAFFMATDYVTRPITKAGQYVFGILLGCLTGIFRLFGPSAEGVSYAIIIGNLLTPLIEKATLPKAFGTKGGKRA